MSLTTAEIGEIGQQVSKLVTEIHLPKRIKSGDAYKIRTALFKMRVFFSYGEIILKSNNEILREIEISIMILNKLLLIKSNVFEFQKNEENIVSNDANKALLALNEFKSAFSK